MEERSKLHSEPVSMYQLFAKMFAYLAKEVTERFGEEGEAAIRAGVQAFGEERGRDIAQRALANGLKNDPLNYLTSYDMERSDNFTCTDKYGEDQVEQLFTQCVFADQWMHDNTEKYGILYCDVIDPAIAKGYNENMECIHEKHFFKDNVCTFCFRMKKDIT